MKRSIDDRLAAWAKRRARETGDRQARRLYRRIRWWAWCHRQERRFSHMLYLLGRLLGYETRPWQEPDEDGMVTMAEEAQ